MCLNFLLCSYFSSNKIYELLWTFRACKYSGGTKGLLWNKSGHSFFISLGDLLNETPVLSFTIMNGPEGGSSKSMFGIVCLLVAFTLFICGSILNQQPFLYGKKKEILRNYISKECSPVILMII